MRLERGAPDGGRSSLRFTAQTIPSYFGKRNVSGSALDPVQHLVQIVWDDFEGGNLCVVAAIFMDGLTVREMCRGEKNDVEEARGGGE